MTFNPPPNKPEGDVLLTPKEAARFLKVSTSWLAKRRMDGDGPPFICIGRAIRYSRATLQKWLVSNTRKSTSEYETNNTR